MPSTRNSLANEEVIDGKSERGGHPVERRPMKQWMLKNYCLCRSFLEDLEEFDWPESIKDMQRNWIGRSEGAEVTFGIDGYDDTFTVFTTRPDTLFGATYAVLHLNIHLLIKLQQQNNKQQLKRILKQIKSKSDLERTDLAKEKTGVFTGAYAINPVNGEKMPIWIADYVLMSYGTGAIMAVPAHDERDYEFAEKFDLAIREVVAGGNVEKEAYTGDGEHVNSDFLNGLE